MTYSPTVTPMSFVTSPSRGQTFPVIRPLGEYFPRRTQNTDPTSIPFHPHPYKVHFHNVLSPILSRGSGLESH